FFLSFPHGALGRRFAQLHEPRRQRPLSIAGFDGSPAKQHTVAEDGYDTDHVARVLVVHRPALVTDVPHAIVFGRDTPAKGCAADGTELLCPWCGEIKGRRLRGRSEEHTSELQSRENIVCR